MASKRTRVWRSFLATLAVFLAGASFSPLAAAPGSRVLHTARLTVQAGERIGRGVEGAVKTVERMLSPSNWIASNVPFGPIIVREAKKNGLRPELVAAVIQQESKFEPRAKSPAGAVGLMQLLPRTGRWMGVSNLRNPEQNIIAGTKYLRYLSDQFNGNEKNVVAAYNAGPGNVHKFGGLPPFRETRTYVRNVFKNRNAFLRAAASDRNS